MKLMLRKILLKFFLLMNKEVVKFHQYKNKRRNLLKPKYLTEKYKYVQKNEKKCSFNHEIIIFD